MLTKKTQMILPTLDSVPQELISYILGFTDWDAIAVFFKTSKTMMACTYVFVQSLYCHIKTDYGSGNYIANVLANEDLKKFYGIYWQFCYNEKLNKTQTMIDDQLDVKCKKFSFNIEKFIELANKQQNPINEREAFQYILYLLCLAIKQELIPYNEIIWSMSISYVSNAANSKASNNIESLRENHEKIINSNVIMRSFNKVFCRGNESLFEFSGRSSVIARELVEYMCVIFLIPRIRNVHQFRECAIEIKNETDRLLQIRRFLLQKYLKLENPISTNAGFHVAICQFVFKKLNLKDEKLDTLGLLNILYERELWHIIKIIFEDFDYMRGKLNFLNRSINDVGQAEDDGIYVPNAKKDQMAKALFVYNLYNFAEDQLSHDYEWLDGFLENSLKRIFEIYKGRRILKEYNARLNKDEKIHSIGDFTNVFTKKLIENWDVNNYQFNNIIMSATHFSNVVFENCKFKGINFIENNLNFNAHIFNENVIFRNCIFEECFFDCNCSEVLFEQTNKFIRSYFSHVAIVSGISKDFYDQDRIINNNSKETCVKHIIDMMKILIFNADPYTFKPKRLLSVLYNQLVGVSQKFYTDIKQTLLAQTDFVDIIEYIYRKYVRYKINSSLTKITDSNKSLVWAREFLEKNGRNINAKIKLPKQRQPKLPELPSYAELEKAMEQLQNFLNTHQQAYIVSLEGLVPQSNNTTFFRQLPQNYPQPTQQMNNGFQVNGNRF